MTVGRFKGQPVDSLPSQYLAWLVTRDHIRFKHWPLVKEALRVLRSRDLDAILNELKVEKLGDHRPTPEQIAKREVEKAEKLQALEVRRAEEKARRRAERRAARMKEELEMQAAFIRTRRGEPPPGTIIDASYYARQARQKADDPDDISDLI